MKESEKTCLHSRPRSLLCFGISETHRGGRGSAELENDEEFNEQVQRAVQAMAVEERPTREASLLSRLVTTWFIIL